MLKAVNTMEGGNLNVWKAAHGRGELVPVPGSRLAQFMAMAVMGLSRTGPEFVWGSC